VTNAGFPGKEEQGRSNRTSELNNDHRQSVFNGLEYLRQTEVA